MNGHFTHLVVALACTPLIGIGCDTEEDDVRSVTYHHSGGAAGAERGTALGAAGEAPTDGDAGSPAVGTAGQPGTPSGDTSPEVENVDCSSVTPTITVSAMLPTFDPANPLASAGDVVEFENTGPADHTATSGTGGDTPSPDGLWDTGTLAPGESACLRFNNPGSYDFYCAFHPAAMQGTLTVDG